MANTFHLKHPESIILDNDERHYILKSDEIKTHPIWRSKGFWEYSLMERISTDLQYGVPVLWDEMSSDGLREAVISIHNIVFGQLGAIAFTMHELGLTYNEVVHTIIDMSNEFQLVEEQEYDLIISIRRTYNLNIPTIQTPPKRRTVSSISDTTIGIPAVIVGKVVSSSDILNEIDSKPLISVKETNNSKHNVIVQSQKNIPIFGNKYNQDSMDEVSL